MEVFIPGKRLALLTRRVIPEGFSPRIREKKPSD
jgi:hypothetical protein